MKQKTTSVVTDYNERVQSLWLELNKDDEENGAQNWQEKLLQKARLLTKSLTHIFKQTSSLLTYVSTSSRQKFSEASEKANNLYQDLKLESTELTDNVITRAQENLHKLQEVLVYLGNTLVYSIKVQETSETIELTEFSEDSNSTQAKAT